MTSHLRRTLCFSLSVAGACARAVCDPLVNNGVKTAPLSIITRTGALSLPGGELLCAIGTDYADKGGNAVIMAGECRPVQAMPKGIAVLLVVGNACSCD